MEEKLGWEECEVGVLFETVTGNTPSKKDPANYGFDVPFIKPPELDNSVIKNASEFLSNEGAEKARIVQEGAVLVTCIGNLGRVGLNKKKIAFNQQINAIKPTSYIESKFTFYQAQSLFFKNQLENLASATTVAIVNKSKFDSIRFFVAPIPEQRAIVSRIEQLFSELDNGITNLRLAQEQLKVYRQAVLKKAFDGELTKEWREKNTNIETASKLLDMISEKRKVQWENEQLAKYDKTGKKPKDDLWKQKYKENDSPDTTNLPNLPKSWCWVYPEQIASWDDLYALAIGPFGSNLKVSDYTYEGIPLVFVRNIRSGIFTNQNTKYVSKEKAQELRPHWINPHDILITKMGEPPGEACLYPVGHPLAIITADCIKFHLCSLLDNPIYFVYAINSSVVKSQITSITMGVAQKKISLERFKTIVLPFPPLSEQHAIVEEIETRLSVYDKMAQDIDEALEKAEALRQSILKKAFDGRLLSERELAEVRRAEDWEPAEVLLERIRAERVGNRKK